MTIIAVLASLFYAACLALAAVGDWRRLTIPNSLTVALTAGAPAWHLCAGTGVMAMALAGAAVLFAAGILLFSAGWVGGGDVKLIAATALWLAPADQIALLTFTALAGGLLATLMLAWPAGAATVGAHRQCEAPAHGSTPIPYGVAIAIGGLAAFPWTIG